MSANFIAWFELYKPEGELDEALRELGLDPEDAMHIALTLAARQTREVEEVKVLAWCFINGLGARLAPGPVHTDLRRAAQDLAALIEEHERVDDAYSGLVDPEEKRHAARLAEELIYEDHAPGHELAGQFVLLGVALGELSERQ